MPRAIQFGRVVPKVVGIALGGELHVPLGARETQREGILSIVTSMLEQETKGRSSPLGASVSADGANFSVYSKNATSVDLLFFDGADDTRPSRVVPIDPATNRTYHYWHVFVPGVKAGQIYGYRVSGAFDPANGMRFDPYKILLDPYGLAVAVPQTYSREAAKIEGDNTASAMKSVMVDPSAYDWEGDTPLHVMARRKDLYADGLRFFICKDH